MKKTKKIILIIFLILFVPIIIINISVIYKSLKYPDKIPDFIGYKPMIVMTGSMEDIINTGDVVIVKEVNSDELKINDIIAFRTDDVCTTHRIVAIKESDGVRSFVTKGDANNTEDSLEVSSKEIEGIYVFKLVGLGHFLLFLQEPLGLAVILMGIFSVGVITYLIIDKKKIRKEVVKKRKIKKDYL